MYSFSTNANVVVYQKLINIGKYESIDKITQKLSMHPDYPWCRLAEVKFTPTLLIDGHQLPKAYQI